MSITVFPHMKPILSFGFICGIAPWIIKVLDKKMPHHKKEQFGAWVDTLTPRLGAWHPNALYLWAKSNRRKYQTAFSAFVPDQS
jgi:hypothetical protein